MRVLAFAAVSCVAACGLAVSGLGSFDSTSDAGVSGDLDGSLAPPPAIDGAAPASDADEGQSGPLPDVAAPTSTGDAATPDAVTPGSTVDASPADDAGEDAPPGADAGDALSFASGAYVDIGAMPIPGDFTLEAWVKPATGDGGTAEADVVAEDRNGQSAGQLRLGITAGALFFMMSDAAGASFGLFTGTGYALQSSQTLAPGAWSHVAVTKSGASFALYVQAAQVATFTATSSFTYGGPSTAFRIAGRVAADGTSIDSAFTGTIDEVRVWNAARSGSQIAGTMNETVDPSDSTLLAYWRFDDGSGLAASDEEGRYPGTLVAGPVWVTSTAF